MTAHLQNQQKIPFYSKQQNSNFDCFKVDLLICLLQKCSCSEYSRLLNFHLREKHQAVPMLNVFSRIWATNIPCPQTLPRAPAGTCSYRGTYSDFRRRVHQWKFSWSSIKCCSGSTEYQAPCKVLLYHLGNNWSFQACRVKLKYKSSYFIWNVSSYDLCDHSVSTCDGVPFKKPLRFPVTSLFCDVLLLWEI